MAQPIWNSNFGYHGSAVPYCSDDESMVCPLMRTHKDEDLSKCDACDNYPYKKPIYTQAELLEGAEKNRQRRVLNILDRLEKTLSNEQKDNIAKKVADQIIVEKFFLIKETPKQYNLKKKYNKKTIVYINPEKTHSIGAIGLTDSDKRYCLSCLYLPSNCLCAVKENGVFSEIHITDRACSEYKDRVF